MRDGPVEAQEPETRSWLVRLCETEGDEHRQFVVFRVGEAWMAIPVSEVRHVERLRELTLVPGAPPFVRGMMISRGEAVPVVDLAERLGLGASDMDPRTRVLVVQAGDQGVGLLAGRTVEVLYVSEEEVEPAPPKRGGVDERFLLGVARLSGRDVSILELQRLLTTSDAEGRQSPQMGPEV